MKSVRYGSPAAEVCFVSRLCGVHEYGWSASERKQALYGVQQQARRPWALTSLQPALKPLRGVGKSFAMALDTFVWMPMPLMALFVINVLTTLPHKKSRKWRSALVHYGSWTGHLRYVRQTRPQGGLLNSMSPVGKFSDV
jgi:hypothetical protein